MELAFFEREAEAFSASLWRARYRHLAGLDPIPELKLIFERYPELCSPETFERLEDQPIEPAQVRALRAFVAGNVLEAGTREFAEHLAQAEATAHVEWLGASSPYRAALLGRASEADRDRRHAIDELVRAETARLNGLRLEHLARSRELAGELGYRELAELWDDLRGLGLGDLNGLAEQILADTADLYDQARRDQLVHYRLDDDPWAVDLDWIFQAAAFDRDYPSQLLLPAVHATFGDLGVPLRDQENVRLDATARPLKWRMPHVAPISVPDEIVLVLPPVGGRLGLEWLLQLTGVSAPYANVDRTQPFAYRRLGDGAEPIGYGELFRSLARDGSWLRSHLDLADPRDQVRLAAFHSLYRLRLAAVTLRYEQELLASEEPESMAERYVDLFGEALGVRFFPEEYLGPGDYGPGDDRGGAGGHLTAAQDLRGAMFGSQLGRFLKREYDDEWFRSNRAGRFLVDRWREGRRYTVDELVGYFGLDRLEAGPLLAELGEALAP